MSSARRSNAAPQKDPALSKAEKELLRRASEEFRRGGALAGEQIARNWEADKRRIAEEQERRRRDEEDRRRKREEEQRRREEAERRREEALRDALRKTTYNLKHGRPLDAPVHAPMKYI